MRTRGGGRREVCRPIEIEKDSILARDPEMQVRRRRRHYPFIQLAEHVAFDSSRCWPGRERRERGSPNMAEHSGISTKLGGSAFLDAVSSLTSIPTTLLLLLCPEILASPDTSRLRALALAVPFTWNAFLDGSFLASL